MARAVLLFLYVAAVRALYEDQVGSFDWYRQYLGRADYVRLDGATAQGCKRVLVASSNGVVGSIDAETGDLAWRHVYESNDGVIDAVLRSKWGLITVSRGGQLLRSWDVSSGVLRWESLTGLNSEGGGQVAYPLTSTWRPGSVVATLADTSLETLIVAVGSEVAGFKGRSGDLVWKNELESDSSDATISYVHSTEQTVHVVSSEGEKLYIHKLDASNGAVQKKVGLPALWMKTGSTAVSSSCAMVGREVAVCLDVEGQSLYHSSGERFLLSRLESLGISGVTSLEANEDTDGFWVHSDHTHWLLRIQDNSVVVTTKSNDPLSLAVDLEKERVRVGVKWEGGEEGSWVQVVMGEMEEEELSGRVRVSEPRGRIVQGDIYLTRSKRQSVVFQLVLLMEDSSIVMIHSPGDVQWVREDGLGAVVAMEPVDLPPVDQSGSIANFITSTKDEGNPLKLALMRLQLQFSLTKEFVKNLQSRGLPTLLTSTDDLIRDQFSIRKMLVVATETGKLYGIDSSTGAVVWQRLVPNIAPLKDGSFMLRLLRSTSHPPLDPLCILIGVSTATSVCHGLVLYAFNPLSGDHMTSGDVIPGEGHMTCLGVVKQVSVLPHLDHTHSHILLYMTQDEEVHTVPTSHHTLTPSQQLFLCAADVESGLLTGYHLEPNEDKKLTARETWQISYPSEFERIIKIVTKSKHEHTSSPGRVKADRSVQYKYLNPHLFAVITQGYDDSAQEKPFFSVYLVDGVTGATIHHTTHRNAAAPVNLVISENWIVYHHYNAKMRRYEVTVTELHESPSNHTHSVWSSLSPPLSPVVSSQAYTFRSSVVAMTTTQTRMGLTYRNILMGLHSGHILSLPKRLLDPRRDIVATDDMREDGLPIYNPELVLKPVMYINYNRTVGNLRKIYVASSGLESTCLVLACGLDLFFTRVTPSKQFDILAEDFDYHLIAVVVLGLVAGTISLSYLAKRKSLRSLWK